MSYDDIESDDAMALLSRPDDLTRTGLSRRRFLQAMAMGAGGALLGSSLVPHEWRDAWGATPIGANDGILVLIDLAGGNDGLNTVVPYTNATYYAKRGALGITPDRVVRLTADLGLHPNLTYLAERFVDGDLAVVEGVSYPNPNLSHFTSGAYWMSARPNQFDQSTGWLGRWLDALGGPPDVFRAVHLGGSVPLHLVGATQRATGLSTSAPSFGAPKSDVDRRFTQALREYHAGTGYGALLADFAAIETQTLDVGATIAPFYTPALTGGTLTRQLMLAARLINANIGVRVLNTMLGGFDNHVGEAVDHDKLMTELDTALRTFFTTIDPAFASRVTVMTFSEFGRQLTTNASGGTDHGTSSVMLLAGRQVRGGIHGSLPPLDQADRNGRLAVTVDFRAVYANVLTRWLAADANQVLGGAYAGLDLFAAAPGEVKPGDVATPATGFVPLEPSRVLDTRTGVGASKSKVAGGSSLVVPVVGTPGVPATGVTAVALNVTVTQPTTAGFVTVYPSGSGVPATSNLNFTPGVTVPNAVVSAVGADGAIGVFNSAGASHLVADVTGYFATGAATAFRSVTPTRLLDTRDGTGGPKGAVGAAASIDLVVGGSALVPPAATAVVLNVTVTGPTGPGYVTVWPSGQPMPATSSVNFGAGQTVPNLVVVGVGTAAGAAGKVSIFNSGGSSHVIVDVFGYFVPGVGPSLRLAGPRRLLDSRDGFGGFQGPLIAQRSFDLVIAGVSGVPYTASAAVVNVTVTQPTAPGFLTVWGAGTPQPGVSNLNFAPGQTVPNLVCAPIGPGGAISVFNSSGTSHVLVDLFGYFA